MIVKPVKTDVILQSQISIFDLLDKFLPTLQEKSVIAITSKVVALCEGRTVDQHDLSKEELIKREADYYLPSDTNKYGYNFTIKDHSLTSAAGIDESNSGNNYILWPKNSQKTANDIRKYLTKKHDIKNLGVIIADSTSMPMRWGTVGLALGYSGFRAIHDYTNEPDLFNRPFKTSKAGIATGLAAAAVLVMGEGTERTPIVVIEDTAFVEFQDQNPTKEELELFYLKNKEDDLFAPFLNSVKWQKGGSDQA